jgi:apolipoprotein N-acyltransferase
LYGESLRPSTDESGSVSVAAIQPNVPIDGAWDDSKFVDDILLRHVSLSEQAIQANSSNNAQEKTNAIDLVIWPESPMSFEYDRDPVVRRRLAEFARRNNVYLLMNAWGIPSGAGPSDALYNSAVMIAPSGEKVAEYDKNALVPFGEYIPGRSWLPFMGRVKALVGEIAPGKDLTLPAVAGAKLGTLICFEATRPDLARRMKRGGASVLVQISNEAWFGPTSEPRQMLAAAIFRAVENNIELIRVTNSGYAARVDTYGIAHGETPMFETATRTWKIKTAEQAANDAATVYTQYGDAFAATCSVLTVLLLIAATSLQVRRKKERGYDR